MIESGKIAKTKNVLTIVHLIRSAAYSFMSYTQTIRVHIICGTQQHNPTLQPYTSDCRKDKSRPTGFPQLSRLFPSGCYSEPPFRLNLPWFVSQTVYPQREDTGLQWCFSKFLSSICQWTLDRPVAGFTTSRLPSRSYPHLHAWQSSGNAYLCLTSKIAPPVLLPTRTSLQPQRIFPYHHILKTFNYEWIKHNNTLQK